MKGKTDNCPKCGEAFWSEINTKFAGSRKCGNCGTVYGVDENIKMKWIFVSTGVAKQITFVAVNDKGIPVKEFKSKNMGNAYQFEKENCFSNSISDFNKQSSLLIQAGFDGKKMEDKRDITPITKFKKDMKKLDIEVKSPARDPWKFLKIERVQN